MDLVTVSTVLASLKTATDIAKFIHDSGLTLEKAESKFKLAELISALADAKIQISEIQQSIQEKENEIRSLNSQLETLAQMTWNDPFYWKVSGDGKEGPFCQPCFDKDRRLSHLHSNGNGYWACKVCNKGFTEPSHQHSGPFRIKTDYDPLENP